MPDLSSVLIGAGLAVAVQWFVTPHVQRRMRSRERWEQDVHDLGHLLTVELPAVRETAFRTWSAWHGLWTMAVERGRDVTDERIAGQLKVLQDDARKPAEEWEHLTQVRLPWLARRVGARFEPFGAFEVGAERYHYRAILVGKPLNWEPNEAIDLEAAWKGERVERERLVREVEKIAEQIGPGRPGRLARWWRGLLHSERKRVKARPEV
jgi:hypothetical protein